MSESFWASIKDDLSALGEGAFNTEYGDGGSSPFGGEPEAAIRDQPQSVWLRPILGADFGADYNNNPSVLKQVQTAINAAGYTPPLAVNGAWSAATEAGVRWAQEQNGLSVDGIIGDQTLGALGITPPTGTSIESVKGTVKGSVSQALAAVEAEFAPLLSWAQKSTNAQTVVQGKGVAPGFSATKRSVINSYINWTIPFEGWVSCMYIDALGYVTTGMGNLIDPVSMALQLPWKHADGSKASPDEITAAWTAVDSLRSDPKGQKQTSGPATQGGGSQCGYTTLRINKADVQQAVASKLKENENYLAANLSGYAQAPADAQMAAHSMAWAMGPGFAKTWTGFRSAFGRGDYSAAADQSHMQGTGIDMRNMANKLLLTNAAQVKAKKKNADTLYYIQGLNDLFGSSGFLSAHKGLIAGVVAGVAATAGGLIYAFGGRGKKA